MFRIHFILLLLYPGVSISMDIPKCQLSKCKQKILSKSLCIFAKPTNFLLRPYLFQKMHNLLQYFTCFLTNAWHYNSWKWTLKLYPAGKWWFEGFEVFFVMKNCSLCMLILHCSQSLGYQILFEDWPSNCGSCSICILTLLCCLNDDYETDASFIFFLL